jgi:hypothetical protein
MILSQIISAIALIILNPCVCILSKNTFQDHCQTGRKHVKYGKAVLDSSKMLRQLRTNLFGLSWIGILGWTERPKHPHYIT